MSRGALLHPALPSAGLHPCTHTPLHKQHLLPGFTLPATSTSSPDPPSFLLASPAKHCLEKGPSPPARTRHGAQGWHMASPQDHVLPVSSCGKAHCQLREGASLFFRGEIKCFWQQVPLRRPALSPSCVVGRWWLCRRPASTARPPRPQPHMPHSAAGTACQTRNRFSNTVNMVEANASKDKLVFSALVATRPRSS